MKNIQLQLAECLQDCNNLLRENTYPLMNMIVSDLSLNHKSETISEKLKYIIDINLNSHSPINEVLLSGECRTRDKNDHWYTQFYVMQQTMKRTVDELAKKINQSLASCFNTIEKLTIRNAIRQEKNHKLAQLTLLYNTMSDIAVQSSSRSMNENISQMCAVSTINGILQQKNKMIKQAETYQDYNSEMNQLLNDISNKINDILNEKRVASEAFGALLSKDLNPSEDALSEFRIVVTTHTDALKNKTNELINEAETRSKKMTKKYSLEAFVESIKKEYQEHGIKLNDFGELIEFSDVELDLTQASQQKFELAYQAYSYTLDTISENATSQKQKRAPSLFALFKAKSSSDDTEEENKQKTNQESAGRGMKPSDAKNN